MRSHGPLGAVTPREEIVWRSFKLFVMKMNEIPGISDTSL
jgi:hypothetical protein